MSPFFFFFFSFLGGGTFFSQVDEKVAAEAAGIDLRNCTTTEVGVGVHVFFFLRTAPLL